MSTHCLKCETDFQLRDKFIAHIRNNIDHATRPSDRVAIGLPPIKWCRNKSQRVSADPKTGFIVNTKPNLKYVVSAKPKFVWNFEMLSIPDMVMRMIPEAGYILKMRRVCRALHYSIGETFAFQSFHNPYTWKNLAKFYDKMPAEILARQPVLQRVTLKDMRKLIKTTAVSKVICHDYTVLVPDVPLYDFRTFDFEIVKGFERIDIDRDTVEQWVYDEFTDHVKPSKIAINNTNIILLRADPVNPMFGIDHPHLIWYMRHFYPHAFNMFCVDIDESILLAVLDGTFEANPDGPEYKIDTVEYRAFIHWLLYTYYPCDIRNILDEMDPAKAKKLHTKLVRTKHPNAKYI